MLVYSLAHAACRTVGVKASFGMARILRRHRLLFVVLVGALLGLCAVAWQAYLYFMPFPARFRRSKPDLDAYAAKVTAAGPSALAGPPSRIGYFNVLKAEPLPHGFILQSDYGNPFDWDGLAYSTVPLPQYENDAKGEIKQVFTLVQGNWYTVFRP